MSKYPCLKFHQYSSTEHADELLLFAAPAKELCQWAGIPRKGWTVRALYQRIVTEQREKEVKEFWHRAANPKPEEGEDFILGPTAITVAIQKAVEIQDDMIDLAYCPPVDLAAGDEVQNLAILAAKVKAPNLDRLDESQKESIRVYLEDPFGQDTGDEFSTDHDYVLQFIVQLAQMERDPQLYIDRNNLDTDKVGGSVRFFL